MKKIAAPHKVVLNVHLDRELPAEQEVMFSEALGFLFPCVYRTLVAWFHNCYQSNHNNHLFVFITFLFLCSFFHCSSLISSNLVKIVFLTLLYLRVSEFYRGLANKGNNSKMLFFLKCELVKLPKFW